MSSLAKLLRPLIRGWRSWRLAFAAPRPDVHDPRLSSLYTLVSIGSSILVRFDPQAGFAEAQAGWTRYTGQPATEHAGRGWLAALHAEDRQAVLQSFLQSIAAQTVLVAQARLWHAASHSYHYVSLKAAPLLPSADAEPRGNDGRATGWLATFYDEHEAQQRQDHQNRLLSVLESSSDFVALASAEGRLIYLNDAGRRSVGLTTQEDVTRHQLLDFFYADVRDKVRDEVLPKVIAQGFWRGKHHFYHLPSGRSFPVQATIFAAFGSDGSFLGFGCMGRDVTDEETAQKKLEQAVTARDDFLSIASHELKTPLTALKLQLQLCARRVDVTLNKAPEPQRLSHTLTVALEQIERLNTLVDDLLDVSRIRGGKMRYRFAEVDVAELVRETTEGLADAYQQANTPLLVDAPFATFAWADRFRIEQVVVNLLTNALKYGEKSAVHVQVREVDGQAQLTVRDSGMGIDAHSLDKIFLRFERALSRQNISGLGLGLYISKQIIDAHGGEIGVQSTLGEGTCFCVRLLREELITKA